MNRAKKYFILFICVALFYQISFAQKIDSSFSISDSAAFSQSLSEVVIKAFEENKKYVDQPAPVFYLSSALLNHYGNNSILPAINIIPGVRMEQRSPGSVRLNIRGSSLRSPFGVRNVKIYYNGIPVTDPGGDTYLNEFSFSDFGSLQIIKGPAGSIYGAGTGGAMLINSPLMATNNDTANRAGISYEAGSFHHQQINAFIKWGNAHAQNRLDYSDNKSNGYRDHTTMHQKTFSFETVIKTNKQQLDFFAHYNDLFYQTPGALTLLEYKKNPKSARPAAGIFSSSDESKAAVYQKNFLIGINQTYHFTNHFDNTTILYGAYTNFINPTVRNYEYRKEPHFGGRTVFTYQWQTDKTRTTLLAGAEMQQGYFSVKDFGNSNGLPDTLQTDYHVNNFQSLIFAQADIAFVKGWDITAGASINQSSLRFNNLYPAPVKIFKEKFKNIIVPRIALSKKINRQMIIYAAVSAGFSPPTISQLLPSTSVLNTSLQAEKGIDYEIGSRGNLFHHKLYYDITAFLFNVSQSISQRRDSSGADYFVNAGGDNQHGIETYLNYKIFESTSSFINNISVRLSESWNQSRYKNYKVVSNNYSENNLPGVPANTFISGLDISADCGLSAHIIFNYTSKIPLNDANTVYADSYNLLGLRINYQHSISKIFDMEIFCGADNLLNEKYSLGNDINAAGGRYYNAAPEINFYTGIDLKSKF